MKQQLSLSARPRTLDALVGQQKIVEAIRGHMKSGRLIKSWLFTGPKGTGKTSIARIMAMSYQCTHQQAWGRPCKECYKRKTSFDIVEINAANLTGVDKVREAFSASDYGPLLGGRYRVYILDEVHRLSPQAQDLCLKYFEDSPSTAIFILCSTNPSGIKETLRSRCIGYEMTELGADDVQVLVERLLKRVGSVKAAERLAEALVERHVGSPRLITQAVEKYLAGLDPEEAAKVEGVAEVNMKALTRSVVRGAWADVARALLDTEKIDSFGIRLSLISYLRVMLLESPEVGPRSSGIAAAIVGLTHLDVTDDKVMAADLAAVLYELCAAFAENK